MGQSDPVGHRVEIRGIPVGLDSLEHRAGLDSLEYQDFRGHLDGLDSQVYQVGAGSPV